MYEMLFFYSSDEHSALQPEIHNLTCNSLFSVKYSKRNTPICVAGVQERL